MRSYRFIFPILVLFALLISCSKNSPTEPQPPKDTTPPTVVSVSPTYNSTVSIPAAITATFSEDLNPKTVNDTTFTVGDNTGSVSGKVTYANKIATFTPNSPLHAGATYSMNLPSPGIADKAGNQMMYGYSWIFNTNAPTTPPVLIFSNPANGTTEVPMQIGQITFVFDRELYPFSGFLSEVANYPGGVTTRINGDSLIYQFGGLLSKSTTYTATIGANLEDKWGNKLAAPITVQFTTKQTPPYWAILLDPNVKSEARGVVEIQNAYYSAVNYGAGSGVSIYKVDQLGNSSLFGMITKAIHPANATSIIKCSDQTVLVYGDYILTYPYFYPFIAKFDQAGNNVWLKEFSSINTSITVVNVIQCTDNGFALAIQDINLLHPWLAKADASGYLIWLCDLNSVTGMNVVAGVEQTNDGNFIVVGTQGASKLVAKISATGTLISTANFGSSSADDMWRTIKTSDNGVLACGNHLRSDGYHDYYLAKLDAAGSLLWEHSYTQDRNGHKAWWGLALCEAPNGDYLMSSDGARYNELLRVNSSGVRVWTQTFLNFGYLAVIHDLMSNSSGIIAVGASGYEFFTGYAYMIKMNSLGTF